MNYSDGSEVRLGDRVRLGNGDTGVVVASPESGEFGEGYSKEAWSSLETGALIRTDRGALVHLEPPLDPGFLMRE